LISEMAISEYVTKGIAAVPMDGLIIPENEGFLAEPLLWRLRAEVGVTDAGNDWDRRHFSPRIRWFDTSLGPPFPPAHRINYSA